MSSEEFLVILQAIQMYTYFLSCNTIFLSRSLIQLLPALHCSPRDLFLPHNSDPVVVLSSCQRD